MKRIILTICVLALIPAIAHSYKRQKSGGGSGGPMKVSVQLRTVAVKSAPSYLASTVGTLYYGNQTQVTGESGNWYQISTPAGWIPKSAARKGKVAVDPSKRYAGGSVSHDETALAGKGFNPQVEGQYKRDNASLAAAYAQVDRIEKITVSEAALKKFIVTGKLRK